MNTPYPPTIDIGKGIQTITKAEWRERENSRERKRDRVVISYYKVSMMKEHITSFSFFNLAIKNAIKKTSSNNWINMK